MAGSISRGPHTTPISRQVGNTVRDTVDQATTKAEETLDRMEESTELVRRAALVLSGAVEVDDAQIPILLLGDIRAVFAQRDVTRLASKTLLDDLHSDAFEEHPWQEWNNGRGIKPTGVGRLLSPFGIHAIQLRIEGDKVRGYELSQFADAFSR